ncbi:hypothetical protein MLD38_034529 [Melastoma candidum]|uniref:Uncharacterized protein n=1 Tax=Melastoma candidum TaxID=119954 RepID=A0ACB9MCH0_9MYRT|nr:hypothetical protein MLD38_034529 [Melastoma candidum]
MVVVHLDLGPQGLLLLFACLAFPLLVGLFVRREWRKSVSRGEEVRRLLVLAKEEAARAELEASYGYGGYGDVFSPQPPRDYFCAVCYCPTTTRCSRCKAVRYCSGKCQIMHWRQGHKEECHPPVDVHDFDRGAVDDQKDDHDGDDAVNEVRHLSDSTLTGKNVAGLAESGCSDHAQVKLETDNSSVRSPSASFSGFSSSAAENTSSDDAFGCESIYSNGSGGSDEYISDANARDLLGNPREEHADDTKSHPQIFPASINAADGSSGSSDESTETIVNVGSNADGGPTVEPPKKLSGFWRSNLDSDEKEETSSYHFRSPSLLDGQVQNASDSGIHLRFADESSLHIKHVGDDFVSNHDVLSQGTIPNKLTISNRETISKCEKYGFIGDEDIKPSSQIKNREYESTLFNAEENALRMDSLKFCLPEQPVLLVTEHFASEDDMDVAVSSHLSSSASNTLDSLKASDDTGVCRPVRSSLSKHESSGRATDKVGSFDGKGIFSYESFVKLYTWKEVELLPCGFINCGNSCYANAVLQCLAFTPPLTAYFLQEFHSMTCTKKDWCFMCKFEGVILKAKVGISPISPIEIVSHLRNIGSQLSNGRQEDAHEFLRYAIDSMQSICLAKSGLKCTSVDEETTLIGLTFGGYLRSKIRCTKCQSKSERHERMMDLTVEIEGDIGTLEEALHRFTESETLDGDNKYQCSSCKSYEKARKKLTVLEAPNILTISLKRFQTGRYGKINKRIRFPEILNLAPYMSGTSDNLSVYRLYGVVVHLDVMNATFSGHYICYVKNPQNKWFKIDDSTVTPVELATVLQVEAYMLLYARCSPRAPRSVRNSMAPADVKHRTGPNKANGRLSASSGKFISGVPGNIHPIGSPSEGSADIEALSPDFRRSERATEEDSSSDNFSLFSSNSGEGSCSTDSTRDSASMDDLSDYVLGDVRGAGSPWRTSDSETFSSASSSPAHSRQSAVLRLPAVEKSRVLSPMDKNRLSSCCSSSSNSNSNSGSRGSAISESKVGGSIQVGTFHDVKSGVSARKIDFGGIRSKEK